MHKLFRWRPKSCPRIRQLPQRRQLRRHVEHPDVGERLNRIALGPNVCLVAREKDRAAGFDRRIKVLSIDLGAQQLA